MGRGTFPHHSKGGDAGDEESQENRSQPQTAQNVVTEPHTTAIGGNFG
jgi:hypothetical protein